MDIEFLEISDIVDEAIDAIESKLRTMQPVSAERFGLDPRAGILYTDGNCIVTKNSRILDYYGGFEYVDEDSVMTLGNYKIYTSDDERVSDAIDCYNEREETDE